MNINAIKLPDNYRECTGPMYYKSGIVRVKYKFLDGLLGSSQPKYVCACGDGDGDDVVVMIRNVWLQLRHAVLYIYTDPQPGFNTVRDNDGDGDDNRQ